MTAPNLPETRGRWSPVVKGTEVIAYIEVFQSSIGAKWVALPGISRRIPAAAAMPQDGLTRECDRCGWAGPLAQTKAIHDGAGTTAHVCPRCGGRHLARVSSASIPAAKAVVR